MNVGNINKLALRPRVLVAPLDWGLGHATRCIPIINVLIEHNIEVFIAAEGSVAGLLKEEFPSIVILPLKGYRISYSRRKKFFFLNMLLQLPRMISSIKHEKNWLKKIIQQHKINAVISDNRLGLYHSMVPCVYITHQLFIETGNFFLNKMAQKIHYRFINRFNECWVPDIESEFNFAGKLSHPARLPVKPVKYLGILSRLKEINAAKKIDLLLLLSGPEPQRTIFENILLEQVMDFSGSVILVRGLPGAEKKINPLNKNLICYDHLPANAIGELIEQSENIVTRAGYSTVMDLATLNKTAILVPTPGQTEQEYLAGYLMERKLFYNSSQGDFSLQDSLKSFSVFKSSFIPFSTKKMRREIIEEWVGLLKKDITVLQ